MKTVGSDHIVQGKAKEEKAGQVSNIIVSNIRNVSSKRVSAVQNLFCTYIATTAMNARCPVHTSKGQVTAVSVSTSTVRAFRGMGVRICKGYGQVGVKQNNPDQAIVNSVQIILGPVKFI